ncbi:hypothetical protein [Streptomyces sp. NPDC002526]
MQDTGHTDAPERAQSPEPEAEAEQRSPEAAAALEAVRDALAAKRRSEARERAVAALETYGPDPELYVLLGQAHVAEDEDDHDDEAERVYRRGLDAFPDNLALLAAYAELCRAADALDRPGRAARAAQLVARVEELGPDSPEAQRLRDPVPLWMAQSSPAPQHSLAHTQRHDVRQALAAAPDLAEAARLAEEEAGRHPYSLRLAIRAETLTAFTRPGRPLLLWLVRAPYLSVLAVLAVGALSLVLDAAARWSVWAGAGALLALVPYRLLTVLEGGARTRATGRVAPLPEGAPEPASPLAPPPPPGLRDFAVLGAALTLAVFALVAPMALKPAAQAKDYPRYTVTPPQEFRGEPLASAVPVVDGVSSDLASLWTQPMDVEGAFAYLYGDLSVLENRSGPAALIFGATGDFRGTPDTFLKGYELALSESDSTINEVWQPDPGPGGGGLRCVSYADDTEAPKARTACSWVDDGSYGTVVMNERLDHDTAADAARTARDAVLHGGVHV